MRSVFAMLLLLSVGACRTPPLDFDGGMFPEGDMASSSTGDMSGRPARDLAGTPTSCCGQQGNPGNELGVGRFCNDSIDCQSVQAKICASTFAPSLTFCTMACKMGGPADQCGSGAQCQCGGNGQCACIPGECIQPPPGC